MRKEPIFMYEEGKTICLVEGENGDCLIGTATCHPDDADMANKRTEY